MGTNQTLWMFIAAGVGSALSKCGRHCPRPMSSLVDRYNNWIFDCDGVLWSGDRAISGSLESLKQLREAGKQVVFVTNNATKSRKTYAEKFARLGVEVEELCINTAGSAAAEHCAAKGFKKVFAIGHAGMLEELELRGLEVVCEEGSHGMDDAAFEAAHLDEDVDAVVLGWDKDFSYRKLCVASLYLQNGAHFVVTNPDSADRMAGNRMQPGTGCSAAAIAFSVGMKPDHITVCGKPNQGFLDQLLAKYGFIHTETLMCGDRLDTDIAFGGGKIDTLLVLSGVSLQSDVEILGDTRPTYVAADVENAIKGNATYFSPSLHF